jgi:cytochrome c oxidase assembly factor CtaG
MWSETLSETVGVVTLPKPDLARIFWTILAVTVFMKAAVRRNPTTISGWPTIRECTPGLWNHR